MLKDRMFAKILNSQVMQNKFQNKNIDDFVYASLSQPPIRVIDKNNSDDELDWIVECPNCKSHVCYGTDTFMYSGHIYCSNKGCREEVVNNYEQSKRNDI